MTLPAQIQPFADLLAAYGFEPSRTTEVPAREEQGLPPGIAYYFRGLHPKQGFDMEHLIVLRDGVARAGVEELWDLSVVETWFKDNLEEHQLRLIDHHVKLRARRP